MSDTESDIEDIPHDEIVKRLQVPEFQDSPTSSGGKIVKCKFILPQCFIKINSLGSKDIKVHMITLIFHRRGGR